MAACNNSVLTLINLVVALFFGEHRGFILHRNLVLVDLVVVVPVDAGDLNEVLNDVEELSGSENGLYIAKKLFYILSKALLDKQPVFVIKKICI